MNGNQRNMFFTCLMIAGECDQAGWLRHGMVPVAFERVLTESGDQYAIASKSLGDVIEMGMIENVDGALLVPNFDHWQETSSASRTRLYRERHGDDTSRHGDKNVTNQERDSDGLQRHGDASFPTPLSRRQKADSAAYAAAPLMPETLSREWPKDVVGMVALAAVFLDAFGNSRSEEAIRKYGPAYTDVLMSMRSRQSVTVTIAWQAFCDCLAASYYRPLFGSRAKSALSYLPGATPANGTRRYDPNSGKMTRTGAESAAAKISARASREPAESRS